MLAILKRQQLKDGIGRGLPDTIPSASKSGALDRLRSDVGIIYTRRGRIAMAITVDDMLEVAYTPENPGLHLIWKLSLWFGGARARLSCLLSFDINFRK